MTEQELATEIIEEFACEADLLSIMETYDVDEFTAENVEELIFQARQARIKVIWK